MSTFSGMISTAVTWLCCARRVAIESPTYPVPATAMLRGDGEASFPSLYLIKSSVISKSRASPKLSNCSIDGIKSCCSMRDISALLIPVISESSACVMFFSFLSLAIVSARRDGDNFFMCTFFQYFK